LTFALWEEAEKAPREAKAGMEAGARAVLADMFRITLRKN